MDYSENRKILLARMDKAFGKYSYEAEKLSVLLAEPRDLSSWTSYHDLLRQRTAEVVAYEQYRKLQDELFILVHPPASEDTRETIVG